MSRGNIFEQIPADLSAEVFATLAQGDEVRIERIISSGQSSPERGWYDQDQREWVMLLQGSAEIAFDDGRCVRLGVGDYVDIPAHARHRVTRTSRDPQTIWLAVFF